MANPPLPKLTGLVVYGCHLRVLKLWIVWFDWEIDLYWGWMYLIKSLYSIDIFLTYHPFVEFRYTTKLFICRFLKYAMPLLRGCFNVWLTYAFWTLTFSIHFYWLIESLLMESRSLRLLRTYFSNQTLPNLLPARMGKYWKTHLKTRFY